MTRREQPCYCKEYKFPHRLGGGHCVADPGEYICGNCGMPTRAKPFDYKVSVCCEARLLRNEEGTPPVHDDYEQKADNDN